MKEEYLLLIGGAVILYFYMNKDKKTEQTVLHQIPPVPTIIPNLPPIINEKEKPKVEDPFIFNKKKEIPSVEPRSLVPMDERI